MNGTIYPLVPVRFIGPKGTSPIIDALLDSGSDFILIPINLAEALGLSMHELPKPIGTAGGERRGFEARCDFELGRGGRVESYTDLKINVIDSPDTPVLIGRDPIFKDFKVIFEESLENITLQKVRN
jgi:hypothetical protein